MESPSLDAFQSRVDVTRSDMVIGYGGGWVDGWTRQP